MEKISDRNIWSAEEKKNRDGKGGKFLEKENCSCSAKGSPFLKRVGSLLESPK